MAGAAQPASVRNADRKACRRDRLTAKARDRALVIAPATTDRTEAHWLAIIARDFEGELGLEHGAGVIFEATDDGGVDADTAVVIFRGRNKTAKFLGVP